MIAEDYYDKIINSKDPGGVSAEFLREIHGINISLKDKIKLRRIAKVFGAEVLYLSILETINIDNIVEDKAVNLISSICSRIVTDRKKRSYIEEIDIERLRKLPKKKTIDRRLE